VKIVNLLYQTGSLTLVISNMFSGEECWGRFLDLHTLHETFLNLRGVRNNISYIVYLKEFQGFRHLRPQTKNEDYLKYLIQLQEYLESFLKRVQPLVNHDKLMNKLAMDFNGAWESGVAPGQKELAQLESSGDGLFCEVCQKVFTKDTVFKVHLDGKQHKKNIEKLNETKEDEEGTKISGISRVQRQKEISRREFTILKLCQGEKLSVVIPGTINNVERRSLLSDRERQVCCQTKILSCKTDHGLERTPTTSR
jgi:splicing factor 3A subunit 3